MAVVRGALRDACDDRPARAGPSPGTVPEQALRAYDLEPRAAYSLEHEQIDGAFTFDTDDYLLEGRWWKTAMQPTDVHPFKAKVESKAKHTFGLFISVNGFTAGAVEVYLRATSAIFMDGADLVPVLEGRIDLAEVLLRKRRHAAETGNPMLPVAQMLA